MRLGCSSIEEYVKRGMIGALLAMLILQLGCVEQGRDSGEQLREVSIRFDEFYSIRFAGFFTAEEKGYYQDNSLKVTFLPPPGSSGDALEALLSGEADFAVAPGAKLLSHGSGEIVALAAIYQRDPHAYVSIESSGIHTLFDLEGTRIGYHDETSRKKLFYLASQLSLNTSTMELVPVGQSLEPLINGSVDVYMGSLLDEALRLEWSGYDVNTILEEDYGMGGYDAVIVARRDFIEAHPAVVSSFLNATLAGWEYAAGHPEKAVNYTVPYLGTFVLEQQLDAMRLVSSMVYTGEHPVGWMEDEVWEHMARWMRQAGIANTTNLTSLYTTDFLYELYTVDKE